MALPKYRIVINTFERKPWPVVTHIFHGDTLEEALGYCRAHKQADEFLRSCGEKGSYPVDNPKFRCRNKMKKQVREGKRWRNIS